MQWQNSGNTWKIITYSKSLQIWSLYWKGHKEKKTLVPHRKQQVGQDGRMTKTNKILKDSRKKWYKRHNGNPTHGIIAIFTMMERTK